MAITPLSTPLKTEYKPLGFEAFAQPLSKMSENYEKTLADVMNTDYEINRLSKDDPRAKALLTELDQKTNDMAANLMQTKNYSQASQKLLQFNKAFNKSPELSAIKGNYETLKKAKEEMRKKVAENKATEQDYKLWDFMVNNEFQGTNFDKSTGEYKAINAAVLGDNEETNIRKEAREVAAMEEADAIEYLKGNLQLNAFQTQQFLEKIKGIDKDKVANDITPWLLASDKYRNWSDQDATLKWYYQAHQGGEESERFKLGVIDNVSQQLVNQKEHIDAKLKTPNLPAEQIKAYQDAKAKVEEEGKQLANKVQLAQQNGTTDDLSKELFIDNARNRFNVIGDIMGSVVSYKEQSLSQNTITDPIAQAAYTDAKTTIKDMPAITNAVSAISQEGIDNPLMSGNSTNVLDELYANDKGFGGLNAYDQMDKTTPDKIPALKDLTVVDDKMLLGTSIGPEVEIFNNKRNTAKNLYVINDRDFQFTNKQKELTDQAALLLQQKAGKSAEEQREIDAKVGTIYEQRAALSILNSNEQFTLSRITESLVNSPNTPQPVKDLWIASGKDVKVFNSKLNSNVLEDVKRDASALNIMSSTYLNPQASNGMTPDLNSTIDLQKEYEATKQNQVLTSLPNVSSPTTFTKILPEYTNFATMLTNTYKRTLEAKAIPQTAGVILNPSASKYIGPKVEEIKNSFIERESFEGTKAVTYNPATGKTSKPLENIKYETKFYNLEEPTWVGDNERGEPIFEYNLKRELQVPVGGVNSAVANAINSGKQMTVQTNAVDEAVTKARVAEFKKANPDKIYLVMEGTSYNLGKSAEQSYLKFGKAAMMVINEDTGAMAFKQNLDNFALPHILGNPDRNERYRKTANSLDDALKNGEKLTITQPPAVWKDNANGTREGFSITYFIEDGAIQAGITPVTMSKTGTITQHTSRQQRTTINNTNNILQEIVKNDLMFGTGDERDVVYSETINGSRPYVPAFENPGLSQLVFNK
jgi:hypothetical protein